MAPKSENFLELTGEMCIDRARDIKDLFLNCLTEKGPVNLDLDKLENIDITFIQIFYAFLIQAEKRSIDVTLHGDIQGRVRRAMDLAGFEFFLSEGKISLVE